MDAKSIIDNFESNRAVINYANVELILLTRKRNPYENKNLT